MDSFDVLEAVKVALQDGPHSFVSVLGTGADENGRVVTMVSACMILIVDAVVEGLNPTSFPLAGVLRRGS
jgi:hypothetical protein